MATKKTTIVYMLDLLGGVGGVRARKTFGEHAVYCKDKVMALDRDN